MPARSKKKARKSKTRKMKKTKKPKHSRARAGRKVMRKKAKRSAKRVIAKKAAKHVAKKVKATKKSTKKPMKKLVVAKKTPKKAVVTPEKVLGKVTHYYDRIGVAIVELQDRIRRGDMVCLKKGELEIVQPVSSLQIEHAPVEDAGKGDVVGLKVNVPVKEGTLVIPA